MKKYIALAMAMAATLQLGAENSKYISRVYDFVPAPGQFVNTMPDWEEGDTKEKMLEKVAEQLVGYGLSSDGMISLGAYGGYVVFGFDHPVVNVEGEYDFKIYGNATVDAQYGAGSGSCEPGIVMVSEDTNGNGVPDDAWYELAGSEYAKASTLKKYKITYYKPAADRAVNADPDPNNKAITDKTYIKWTSNNAAAASGYVMRNSFHGQSYWPNWIDSETLVFEGTLLESGKQNKGTESAPYYTYKSRDWGYVDDLPNATCPGFKIDWAVDADGNQVKLAKVDFVKVYTASNEYAGHIGELSTEITGAEDLHPTASVGGVEVDSAIRIASGEGYIKVAGANDVKVYSLTGALMGALTGDGELQLSRGVYVVRADQKTALVQVK